MINFLRLFRVIKITNSLFVIAILLFQSNNLIAQTKTESIVTLAPVVITSYKVSFLSKTLPVSASVIPKEMIEQEGINSLKNISALVPNLYMPDYGSKLNSPIYIRGVGSRVNSPSVGLYVDGIPYFEASAFDFDFFDIESVEVLRGPQGTLYGRNTLGGIINVRTASPLNTKGTTLRMTAGNYGHLKTSLTNYTKIGERLGLATGVNFQRRGGYFENKYTGTKADRQQTPSGRLRLSYRHNIQTYSEFHVSLDESRQNGYPYGLFNKESGKVDSISYNDKSSYKRTMLSAGYSFVKYSDWGSLRAISGFQNFKDKQSVDQDFTPQSVYFVVQDQTQNMLSQEFIAQSKQDNNYSWIAGVFGFYQHIDKGVDVHTKRTNSHSIKAFDQPTYGLAAYHQSTYNNLFTKGLSATLGVRLDYENSKQGYISDVFVNANTTHLDNSTTRLNFFEFLPKFSLKYELGKHMIYTSVAKGYKTGGFNTSFDTKDEQTFDPETSWNYELGAKLNCFEDSSLELSAFLIDWDNQQITQSLASKVGSMTTNAGRSQSKGFEASFSTKLLRNFTIYANYGYTYASFKEYMFTKYNSQSASVDSIDYSGNCVPQVPRHTLAIGASYKLNFTGRWVDHMIFHSQYTGAGKIYWYDNNKASQRYYGVLNGSISLTRKRVDITLWAKNILKKQYLAYYFESGNAFAQRGRPFTVGLDLKIKF